MVVNLSREDIEKAIRNYIKDEVLSHQNKDVYDMKIVQGKSASAKVELIKITTPVTPEVTE